MANIREIEVNGNTYGLESVNDIYVGYTEPTTEVKPLIWIQPTGVYGVYDIGYEKKANSSSYQGDYTLDDEGNLVETTDTSSTTGSRATKMIKLFKDRTYEMVARYETSMNESNNREFAVYFYDEHRDFLSKVSAIAPTSITAGYQLLEFTLPEGAHYLRLKVPYQNGEMFPIHDENSPSTASDSYYGGSADTFYQYDGEEYIKI